VCSEVESRRPLVVDVKRGSLADGPGIRTVVFFKGCPLRCVFCHNPETQQPEPEIAFAVAHCIRCGACVRACSRAALELDAPSRINRSRCDLCGLCAGACPGPALRLVGKYWTVEELAELLLRDTPFYRHSGGGVTLSGGECTLFPEYLHALLCTLKERGIHLALQTSGYFDYETFSAKILPWLDLIFFDVKFIDPGLSAKYLRRPNERILDNLRRLLAQSSVEVRPRVPLIPGITDSRENLTAIVDYLLRCGAANVALLPYNPLGLEIYARLGRPTPDLPRSFSDPEAEKRLANMFREIVAARAAGVTAC